jgi:hypothetical protein
MTYRFDPNASFIRIVAEILGPLGFCRTILALDTGSTQTVIDASLLGQLGFGPSNAVRQRQANTVGGQTTMIEYRLPGFSALGIHASDFDVCAVALRSPRFDGLLGKDFFRDRVLKIDFRNWTIEVS